MTLYLARHGESAMPGRLLGAADPALNEQGRRQSVELASQLREKNPNRIYASSLKRSRESAEIVAGACGRPLQIDSRLDEIGYGGWDGLTWDEIEQTNPELAERKLNEWWGVTPPDGEPPEDFAQRLTAFWLDLAEAQPASVAIVAHLAVNACLAGLARQGSIDWDATLHFRQDHGEYLEIDA